jgi:hypothetical protein
MASESYTYLQLRELAVKTFTSRNHADVFFAQLAGGLAARTPAFAK